MNHRIVRELASIALATDRELRLELVEVNGQQRVSMCVWAKGRFEWHKLPGKVEVPIGLLGELHNRLTAAMTS